MEFLRTALLVVVLSFATASQFDPHKPYAKGTFFEGWYTRFLIPDSDASFGVIFGLTTNPKTDALPPAMITLMYQNTSCKTCKIESYDVYPEPKSIQITTNGEPVTKDPDFVSPSNFEWNAPGFGYYQTKDNYTSMHFKAGPIEFTAELNGNVPWLSDNSGYGPAGVLDRLPLPLHWFVHSLASPVVSYSWVNTATGQKVVGKGGAAHQEKNWGNSFPAKWIWAEALDQDTGVALAVSGGDLSFGIGPALPIELSHLIGYRNPKTNTVWDFTPANSRLTKEIDACNGRFAFDVYHNIYPRRLRVEFKAEPRSMDTCILGPDLSGFKGMSVESFVTQVEIWAYQHYPLRTDKLLDHQLVLSGGLEFGGVYRCMSPDVCSNTTV